MKFSTPNFKRIMLILSPCAALCSFDAQATVNLNGTPEDYKTARHSGRKCIVMLASDGCGHCRAASPHFAAIAQDPANESVDFLKLKSAENQDVMAQENLDGVPAFLFIDESGAIQNKELGFEDTPEGKDKLRTMVRNHAGQGAVQANVDAMVPVEQAPEEEGVVDKLKGLVIGLFDTIKNIIVTIFDWIKGLFNR